MKFEFEKNYIPSSIIKDFGFDDFLEKFTLDLPLINTLILKPLNQNQAIEQLNNLQEIENQSNKTQIKTLIYSTQTLPNIDYLLGPFEEGSLDGSHVFSLAMFLRNSNDLETLEKQIFGSASADFSKFRSILTPFLDLSFTFLSRSQEEQTLINEINDIDSEIKIKSADLESAIFQQTSLKMYYPHPKEITDEPSEKIKKSILLRVERNKSGYLIDFKLPDEIIKLQKEKDFLIKKLNSLTDTKLDKLNACLKPSYSIFFETFNKRIHKTIHYSLIFIKNIHNLSWPHFVDDKFSCLESIHSFLKEHQKDNYNPLNFETLPGSSVILGSNMSGKTSALRNLYFLTTLCKFGLPLPTKEVHLPFPSDTYFHMRSSGRPELNMSSFTEELSFFETQFDENSFVFVDELFQSTNPSSGLELSRLFLQEYSQKKLFFICSSHYLDLLGLSDAQFFKMSENFQTRSLNLQHQSISLKDEIKKPFELCLNYNLSPGLKSKISTWLKNNQKT